MSKSATPGDLAIRVRAPQFRHMEAPVKWWHGSNPYRTALYNAFSASFPKGEAFFIQSVRHYGHAADGELSQQIWAFTSQEAAHSREHLQFNRAAAEAGYDMRPLEQQVEKRLSLVRQQPPIIALAATMALEHFTAILAHQILADPDSLSGVNRDTAGLWRWHSIEEIEHKGVAFDTWLSATKGWSGWRRWLVRTRVMLHATRIFLHDRTAGALELLRQDGITGWRTHLWLFWEMWGRPGMFRKAIPQWMRWFRPGFHPWDVDDRALIRS